MLRFDSFQRNKAVDEEDAGHHENETRGGTLDVADDTVDGPIAAPNGHSAATPSSPERAISTDHSRKEVLGVETETHRDDRPGLSFWGKEQSVRPPRPPSSRPHSERLSATSTLQDRKGSWEQTYNSDRSLASFRIDPPHPVQDTMEQSLLWKELDETFVDACHPPNAAVLRILKLCFSSLCVVFRETKLNHINDDKTPFLYARIPSIPAMAASMLWSELLGGIHCCKKQGEDHYVAVTRQARFKEEEDQNKDAISTLANTDKTCDLSVTPEQVESFVKHVNATARTPTSPFSSMTLLLSKFSSTRALGASFSSDMSSSSMSVGGTRRRHTFVVPESPSNSPMPSLKKSGWFSFRNSTATSPRNSSFHSSTSSTLSPVQEGHFSMSELQAQERQTRPKGKELLLYCVRDQLAETGFVEIAGRRVDDIDDDDSVDSFDASSDDEESVDSHGDDTENDDDDDGDHDIAMDFSGWTRPRTIRKPRRTQYLQIYKDMQHMYGVHLASSTSDEGGFAVLSKSQDESVSIEPSSRELDTMKRWDDIMAQACLRQLQSDSVLVDPEAAVCPKRTKSDNKSGEMATIADVVVDEELDLKDEATTTDEVDETSGAVQEQEEARIVRWKKLQSLNPFRDATTYAVRAYPTHLMRSGQVVEAASNLMCQSFFLARVCAFGPSEAVMLHISHLTELKRRCDLAIKGQFEHGGDGDCIDPDDIEFAAIQIMLGTLEERFVPRVEIGDKKRRHLKGEHVDGDIGRAYHQVASLLLEKGDNKQSMETYKRALTHKKASLGCNHPSIARTLRHKGHLHLSELEYEAAVDCYTEAARVERFQDDVDHKKVILSLNSIAVIHGMRQEHDKAIDIYSQSLAIQKVHMGDTNPQVAETLNSLGVIYGMKGNYAKAVSCYNEALSIKTNGSGTVYTDVADMYFNLGLVQYKRGDSHAALTAYQKALHIHQEQEGDQNEEVARLLYHMAVVLEEMNDLVEAARHYTESLNRRRRAFGDDHEDVVRTLHNLGLVYLAIGDHERSLDCFEDALGIGREKFGQAGNVADTLFAMGLLYQKIVDFERAIACYTEALEIRRSELGNEHVEVANALHNIGDVHYIKGELDAAMTCYEEAHLIRQATLGGDDIEVAATRNNMGVVYMKRNDHELAMDCFSSALRVRQMKLGGTDEKVGDTLHNMGLVHKNLHEYPQAIDRYDQALQVRRQKARGDHDIKVADTLYNMAIVFANTEQFKPALDRYKEALRTYRETGMTDDHPSIVNTLQWIKWAEKKLHKLSKQQQTL